MERTVKTLEQLQQMAAEVAAKQASVPFEKLVHALDSYNNFVDNIKFRLSEVQSADDFLNNFRKEWQASLCVLNLPGWLCAFHDYLASAEQLNTEVMYALQLPNPQAREIAGLIQPMNDTCMTILQDSETFYQRPFNKEYLRSRLIGDATKRAIYTHLVAVCDHRDISAMIASGEIKKETILSLPRAITARACTLKPLASQQEKMDAIDHYYKTLQELYKGFDLTLPSPIIHKDEPLKGVTFDGRDRKLQYLVGQIKGDFSRVVLTAERYEYTPTGGTPEPAVRVLASIPGVCKPVDIGNLDREFANRLGAYYTDADLALEVSDMGFFQTNDGRNNPYMRMNVTIGEAAIPMEKEQSMKLSDELEDMFSIEELK